MNRLCRYILTVCCVLLLAPAAWGGQVVDRVVGVVNGDIITLFELNERVKPILERFRGRELTEADKTAILGLKRKMLDGMINNILIRQEVARLGIDVSDVELENEVDSYKKRAQMTEEDFARQLKLEGLTRDEFKNRLKDDILRHKLLGFMVKRKVAVTKEDVARYYEANSFEFRDDSEVDLSLIICGPETNAAELRERIARGEISFADAADLYTRGPGVGQGGRIGAMAWNDLAGDWHDALAGVGPGEMTQPFVVQGHEALLFVNEAEEGGTTPLEKVESRIYDKLFQERLEQRFQEYIDNLKANALIEIKL
ncbi:peptidyl-prolyl cis-trans isomerase SurA [Desulfobaculum xiamenense]|uniref:Peptidyl-prolyl cis-trans isomerase SurA n=1 Tax=Desulfobaculum xiamenense TaxID=995050 RepID=A0A846QER3_9BACT|nr:SurA N-terminal domain-containing protein [Desulfobaculum xiamenense]NJB66761.1 peptidyl-prolyl cis-trans isomerase SurA [Desulfobaculum xiamenense]